MIDPKFPTDKLDYAVDWSLWIAAPGDGDTISVSDWIVPAGLTSPSDILQGNVAVIWLDGGVAGEDYNVVNTITTTLGRIKSAILPIRVR